MLLQAGQNTVPVCATPKLEGAALKRPTDGAFNDRETLLAMGFVRLCSLPPKHPSKFQTSFPVNLAGLNNATVDE